MSSRLKNSTCETFSVLLHRGAPGAPGYSGKTSGEVFKVFRRGIQAGFNRGSQGVQAGYSRGTQGIQAAHFWVFSGELRRHLPSASSKTCQRRDLSIIMDQTVVYNATLVQASPLFRITCTLIMIVAIIRRFHRLAFFLSQAFSIALCGSPIKAGATTEARNRRTGRK